MGKLLQIVILTHNRPEYLAESLRVAIAQDLKDAELVVSDNSDDERTHALMKARFANISYIRRTPPLPGPDHFNAVLESCTSEFLVIFHDDDLMGVGYVTTMLQCIRSDATLSAAACNAYILKGARITSRKMMGFADQTVKLKSAEELLFPYLAFSHVEPPPFPSYIYRTSRIRGIRGCVDEGGKHSDVAFLVKTIETGPICWISTPLMYYRFHQGNDGNAVDVSGKARLLTYVCANTSLTKRSKAIVEFRIRYLAKWVVVQFYAGRILERRWRLRIIGKFIFAHIPRLIISQGFWLRVVSRIEWAHR